MKNIFISFIFSIIFVGCYSNIFTYVPSNQTALVKTTIDVDKSKDSTWNQLVASLSSNFFVINTMDNKSGFINLSFTADPEKYIDGGEMHYTFIDNQKGNTEHFDFPASRASAVYTTVIGGAPHQINWQLDLKGKMNILVSDLSSNRSRVTVNINYILNLRDGDFHQTMSFNSGQYFVSKDSIEFRLNGKLEQQILDIFK